MVSAYLESGGGVSDGVELFVDFTPFVATAEKALRDGAASQVRWTIIAIDRFFV